MGMLDFLKKPEEVFVVHRSALFGPNKEGFFEGFMPKKKGGFEERAIEHGTFLLRKKSSGEQILPAEKDENFKQIIPYIILKHKDRYFVYQRTKKGNESRLHEKYSMGVGGHINPISMKKINKMIKTDEKDLSIIDHGMLKELNEEIKHKEDKLDYKVIGYINNEADEVSRVHFGVVYLINLENSVEIKEKDKIEGKLMSLEEIKPLQEKFEDWSKYAWQHIMLNEY